MNDRPADSRTTRDGGGYIVPPDEVGVVKDANGADVKAGDRIRYVWSSSWNRDGERVDRTAEHTVVWRKGQSGGWYLSMTGCANYLGGKFWKIT